VFAAPRRRKEICDMKEITQRGPTRKTLLCNGRDPAAQQQWSNEVRLVVIAPTDQPGCYSGTVNGELLVLSSRTPFLDAARVLVERGCDTNSILIGRHAGSDTNALIAKIGVAARLTVEENRHGTPTFRPYRAVRNGVGKAPYGRLNAPAHNLAGAL
jgi:hypothetical protein